MCFVFSDILTIGRAGEEWSMGKQLLCSIGDWLMILAGTTLMALGVTWFASPLGLVTGGVTGIAIVIQEISKNLFGFGIPLWVTNLALNLPLFLISIAQRGFGFAKKSLIAVVWLSFALWICERLPNPFVIGEDLLLASLLCGVLTGAGIGLVLKVSATTGGTDMLASIIKYHHSHFPIAKLMMVLDAAIILCGLFVFGTVKTLYAIISVVIMSQVINSILEGMYFAKAAFILSDNTQEISQAIFKRLSRGNTGIPARGMYTGQKREMLFVVVSRKEISVLRNIVKQIDPSAFLIITDAREALGEGFAEQYDPLTI